MLNLLVFTIVRQETRHTSHAEFRTVALMLALWTTADMVKWILYFVIYCYSHR